MRCIAGNPGTEDEVELLQRAADVGAGGHVGPERAVEVGDEGEATALRAGTKTGSSAGHRVRTGFHSRRVLTVSGSLKPWAAFWRASRRERTCPAAAVQVSACCGSG
ncbi:hypothetical protein GCM10020221_27210 [Streptomyces thioluteus]|uniref:Uncharacterized protein n=1 Tax=Streptomyces thioluteus TaxID=66431 RepID=A0ABN3WVZ0_STRTU